jgi:hypothetical protein
MGDCMQARNADTAQRLNLSRIVRRNRCEHSQVHYPPTKLQKAKSLIWAGFTAMLP